MATPLAQLVHDVIHDPEVRSQFAAAPESFLAEHGHEHLDAADLREAFFVLADGSAPAEATVLQAGGRAMADDDLDDLHGLGGLGDLGGGSAAAGLAGALSAIFGPLLDGELGADPADLDGTDGPERTDGPDPTDNPDPTDGAIEEDAPGGWDDGDHDERAAREADIDVLDGLLDDVRSPLFDQGPLTQDDQVLDESDGWDDVI